MNKYKIITFVLLISSCIKGLVYHADYSNSLNILFLSSLLFLLIKTEESNKIESLSKEISLMKDSIDNLQNKVSTLSTRNQLTNKSIIGK